MTPTDIANALSAGAKWLKLFPAGTLGPDYLRALRGPFSQASFLAVGGVPLSEAPRFLEAGCKGFGIGHALLNRETASDPARLQDLAEAWVSVIKE